MTDNINTKIALSFVQNVFPFGEGSGAYSVSFQVYTDDYGNFYAVREAAPRFCLQSPLKSSAIELGLRAMSFFMTEQANTKNPTANYVKS